MEGLGRNFNVLKNVNAGAVRARVEDASQTTIVVAGTGAVTLQQHTVASGGTPADLDVDHFYTQALGVWTRTDQVLGNVVTAADDLTVIEVDSKALDDGMKFVSATMTAGTILYVTNDLVVQRNPESLVAANA